MPFSHIRQYTIFKYLSVNASYFDTNITSALYYHPNIYNHKYMYHLKK